MELNRKKFAKGMAKLAALEAEGIEITGQQAEAWLSSANLERTKLWRLRHPDKVALNKAITIRKRKELKVEVLTHYGGGELGCVKCGEGRLACLSLDHINGREENEKVAKGKGKNPEMTGTLYRRLRRENYPRGFQTLCMNCQWVKRDETREYMKRSLRGANG